MVTPPTRPELGWELIARTVSDREVATELTRTYLQRVLAINTLPGSPPDNTVRQQWAGYIFENVSGPFFAFFGPGPFFAVKGLFGYTKLLDRLHDGLTLPLQNFSLTQLADDCFGGVPFSCHDPVLLSVKY